MKNYIVAKHGDYWIVRWTDIQGKKRGKSLGRELGKRNDCGGSATKRQADAFMRRLIADHAREPVRSTITRQLTLGQWHDRYFALKANQAKGTTFIHKRAFSRLIQRFTASRAIESITAEEATLFELWLPSQSSRGSREKPLVEATVCNQVRAVKTIFNFAKKHDLIAAHNFEHLKSNPETKNVIRRVISANEVDRVVSFCSPGVGWMLLLCYELGMRTGEALHQKWRDMHIIDEKYPQALIPKRKTRERICPISREFMRKATAKILHEQALGYARPDNDRGLMPWDTAMQDKTVCGLVEGNRVHGSSITRELKNAQKKAGVEPFTFMMLRKSRITTWRQQGHDGFVIAQWTGHSKAVQDKHYDTISDYDLEKVCGTKTHNSSLDTELQKMIVKWSLGTGKEHIAMGGTGSDNLIGPMSIRKQGVRHESYTRYCGSAN
mgnify:CR=1 FL=1|tara:strand:- start:13685 stop:14998 length:1314 start_codon:yes stop_codon:yes gene_type:complete